MSANRRFMSITAEREACAHRPRPAIAVANEILHAARASGASIDPMDAARAEMASLEGRISSFRDRVRELAEERDELRKQPVYG